MPKFNLPYTLVDTIAYDPAARDLSVEVAKAKATGADALLMVSRLNDAIPAYARASQAALVADGDLGAWGRAGMRIST